MTQHADFVQCAVSGTPGTGAITLGAATTGNRTFSTAFGADATVDILLIDGSDQGTELGAVYNHGTGTITRGTHSASTTGSQLSLSADATVAVAAPASWGNSIENFLGAWGALSGENSITGTATAVIGRLNVCSGTTADYTVTLPAVSGNARKYIGFVMAAGLTKLVTLDGNSTETIDGALTRVMWAQETALLYCDGTTWRKIAGKTIAAVAIAAPSANAVGASSDTQLNLNTSVLNPTGFMTDTANNQILIPRTGIYKLAPAVRIINAAANDARFYGGVWRDRGGSVTQWIVLSEMSILAGSYGVTTTAIPYSCQAGDKMRLYWGGIVTATLGGSGTTENSFLLVEEMPSW